MISTSHNFRVAPQLPAVEESHVWQFDLDTQSSADGQWEGLLSSDEHERALRFHFPLHGRRFSATRRLLRIVLGAYLDADPRTLCFRYSDKGKPALGGIHATSPLRFNLSHSEDVVLLAITLGREIGVDVEYMRPDFEFESTAHRFFSAAECESFDTIPLAQKRLAFFNCWTRKEAFIKAKGDGLSLPLNQFDVSLIPGTPAKILATRPDAGEKTGWSLHAIDAGPDYAAALVAEGRNVRIIYKKISSILDFGPE
jgi:4'-phosphopantetheinyl transferase